MPARYFGLNKKQVDEYLESISKGYDDRLNEIRQKIDACSEENKRLNQKLRNSAAEKDKYEKKELQIEQAEANTAKSITLLIRSAEKDLNEMESSVNVKLATYDDRISLIKNEISKSKKRLDSLLESVSNLLDEKYDSDFQQDEAVNGTTATVASRTLTMPNTCKVISYNGNHASVSYDIPAQKQPAKVITASAGVKKASGFWDIEEYSMTGAKFNESMKITSASGAEPIEMQKKKLAKVLDYSLKSINTIHSTNDGKSDINVPIHAPMEFWDEIPSTEVFVQKPADEILHKAEIESFEETAVSNSSVLSDNTKNINTPPLVEEKRVEKKEEIKPEQYAAQTQRNTPSGSPAVSKEINTLRTRYIAGKIAGETLYDMHGGVIISKNEVITQEVITRAEVEGRLSELIVNMILPGME